MKTTLKKGGTGSKIEGNVGELSHLPPLENPPKRKKPKTVRPGKKTPISVRLQMLLDNLSSVGTEALAR